MKTSTEVITMIDIGLNIDEYYVQFNPPATFGVIYNQVTKKVYLVRADGERGTLRRASDKIYSLRGFIGLRRREDLDLELGWKEVEDDIIRNVLLSFGSIEELKEAVCKFCSFAESADIIMNIWAPTIFPENIEQDDKNATNDYDGTPDPIHGPNLEMEEYEDILPSLLTPTQFSEGASELRHVATSFDSISDPSPTSLQEFSLPVAIPTYSPTTDCFTYTTFPPTRPTAGIQTHNPIITIDKKDIPRIHIPVNKEGFMSRSVHPEQSDTESSFNMAPFIDVEHNYPSITTQYEPIPLATAINPFFPPLNPSAPSPHKRHRDQHPDDVKGEVETIPDWNNGQRNEIFDEIQALVCLEVIKTRELTVSMKFRIVANIMTHFGLPWNDAVVARCYSAIDIAVRDCVGRLQEYFLVEGIRRSRSQPKSTYSEYFSDDATQNHECDICNQSTVDVSAILRTPHLREAIARFYQIGIQLGIKAAWDDDFRDRGFENSFYSLDCFTANFEFPRKGGYVDYKTYLERKKRRLVYPDTANAVSLA